MEQRAYIECPFCEEIQKEDLYDLVEGDVMEGNFKSVCDMCDMPFEVDFEFIPHVAESIIG